MNQGAVHGLSRMIRTTLSRFYAQTTPRGRGMIVMLVVVLLVAFATGGAVLYRLSYFLAVVLVGSYAWTLLSVSRLTMRVEKQSSVTQVGGVLKGSIYVRNSSPLPTGWLEILQMSDMPGYVFGEVTRLPAQGWAEWKTQGFCYTRGVYVLGALLAIASDPLGLFRVKRVDGRDQTTVVVYPGDVQLPCFSFPMMGHWQDDGAMHGVQTRSPQASTVREYEHGDSLNRIHWPSTARRDQLMSKAFDAGHVGNVWIVLDLEHRIQRSEGMEKTDEYAAAAAASLAHRALTQDLSVGLITCCDQEYVLHLGSGSRQMARVLEMLVTCRTEGNASLSEALSRNAVRFGRFDCVLVVTSSTDMEWVPILESLEYSGVTTMVVLVDPASFGGDQSCSEVSMKLVSSEISVYMIRKGDMLSPGLSQPVGAVDLLVDDQRARRGLASVSQVQ